MSYVKLGATIRLAFGTSDPATGGAVNADATPVVTVYEQGVALGYAPAVTGLAVGLYEVAVVCNSANGFEVGKEYTATVTAVVGAVTARDGLGGWTVSAVSPDDLATAAALAIVDDFVDTEITNIQSRLPAALVAGRIDASVGAVAADTIDASAIAASAVTEIQSGLATAAALATVDGVVDQLAIDLATVGGNVDAIRAKTDALPADPADASDIAASIAAVIADTEDIQARLPAALVLGRISAHVGAVATGALTADALASDAASEIASAVDTLLSLGHGAGQWEGGAGGSAPTAGEVADAVWDEARAGHNTAGSFGEALDAKVSSRLAPTVEGRTLDVTATGEAGIDWANIGSPASTQNLSGTTVKTATDLEADLFEIAGLMHRNALVDNVVRSSGTIISARLRIFADATALAAATAGAADGAENEVSRYEITATVDGDGRMTTYKARKTL